mmetsp:Transcript_56508/g.113186  ORF Transcript_56508/g.113186 Transcript_56508/m.113186 type:complete len:371 (-) Transcript_56508:105-1217(-)
MKRRFALDVLYQDHHLIAINKPNGFVTQPDSTGSASMWEITRDHCGQNFLGTVHRLDSAASGALIFGKTNAAARKLSELFRRDASLSSGGMHGVFFPRKTYLAVVRGIPLKECGRVSSWVEKCVDTSRARRVKIRPMEEGIWGSPTEETPPPPPSASRGYIAQAAALEWQCIAQTSEPSWEHLGGSSSSSSGVLSLLAVRLLTGRRHQIRAQLSHIGLPICGDSLYGGEWTKTSRQNPVQQQQEPHCRRGQAEGRGRPSSNVLQKQGAIALHAAVLSLPHPSSIGLVLPPPSPSISATTSSSDSRPLSLCSNENSVHAESQHPPLVLHAPLPDMWHEAFGPGLCAMAERYTADLMIREQTGVYGPFGLEK